ncbi:hypothetical protein ACO0K3_05495 [Undibacterium sp. Rencai35W]
MLDGIIGVLTVALIAGLVGLVKVMNKIAEQQSEQVSDHQP